MIFSLSPLSAIAERTSEPRYILSLFIQEFFFEMALIEEQVGVMMVAFVAVAAFTALYARLVIRPALNKYA